MRGGFGIGRLFGIKIVVDWSWLVIFLLVVGSLVAQFGQWHPDWSLGFRVGISLAGALLFFASVLAHELAHSLMAQAQGMDVRSITLFLFGGVSNIEREPPSPRAEFLITIVGPITSVVLGIAFSLAAVATSPDLLAMAESPESTNRVMPDVGPVSTVLLLLGQVNIILGVFNMLPGFPLDGGRVLRSIVWSVTNNLRQATFVAANVGRVIAWLMILAGVSMIFGATIPFFGTGAGGGIWLAFIGWFLNQAASASYQQLVMRDLLEDVPVHKVMRSNVTTVSEDLTIDRLVDDHLMTTDERAFPVVSGSELVGLITLEDVRGAPRSEWDSRTVSELMTPREQLEIVEADEDAADAATQLARSDVAQLPVLRNGELVGLIRRRDLVRYMELRGDGTGAGSDL